MTPKTKVIYWQKELDKAGAPLMRQMRALWIKYKKEAIAKGYDTDQREGLALWYNNYEARHEALDRKMMGLYRKLWDKCHTKDGKVKAGYMIKF